MFLAAVIDWHSRYVLSWRLSNTLDGRFCLEALEAALGGGRPEIFNTDQGSQFTARAFTGRLEEAGVAVSMDGRGRALDNVFIERLWRSLKYEEVYLKAYRNVKEYGIWAGGLVRGSTTTSGPIRASAIGRPPRSIAARSRSGLEGREGSRA